ncbi:putative GPI-anchored cupredoxin [Colletotrichum tanaceti]|uniref:Putative GPI-anchored cupredoxin n=1 Tax=Colletotrichum tanaceti TaxID=1306861 RepID=A0A4U6X1L7_9PEZI|nr:putative GPI-anchored cupredoxin [Colletotrichum tanaceti]TKW48639.1 putative GPI-anchored cupredoxin [Colletotrichum tanaceti]
MHYSALLAAIIPAVMAQSGSGDVHVVKVGDGGLTFDPISLTAAVGDVVEFHFYPRTHSVAQSAFDSPCQPLNGTAAGFFSGHVQVASGVSPEVFTVQVTDSDPKWYYCATGQHCQGGMVGVINPPSSGERTIEQYSQAAGAAQANVEPSATGGGTLGPAASGSPSPSPSSGSGSGSSSGTPSGSSTPSASSTTQPSAGIEARGNVRWGLLSLGIAAAGFFGGLLI